MALSRRHFIASASLAAIGLSAPSTFAAKPVLRVGDQAGMSKALVTAAGVLEGADYDVQWTEFVAASPLLEAISGEALDVGLVGDAPLCFAVAAGAKVKGILALGGGTGGPDDQSGGLTVLVTEASTIKTVADLKGRKIVTTRGSIGHFIALAALRKAGIKPDEVTFVFLSPADARLALGRDGLEAWAVWDPYVALSEVEGGYRALFNGRRLVTSNSFVIATDSALASKRPIVADYVRRLEKAMRWQDVHGADYAEILSKLTRLPVPAALKLVSRGLRKPAPMDDVVDGNLRLINEVYAEVKMMPAGLDLSKSLDRSFPLA
jgi:sulfonate transport system substrate-binding protein